MTPRTFHTIAALLLPLLLWGCMGLSQPARRVDYYTLEYDPPGIAVTPPLPVTLHVRPFQISPEYDTDRIIYQTGPYLRQTYTYHRWRASPAQLVAYFLARDLKLSALFAGAFAPDINPGATHEIEGIVDAFHELDTKDGWYAIMTITITLLKVEETDLSQRIMLQKQYSYRESCSAKTPVAVAAAMSRAMAAFSREVIGDLHGQLKITGS